MANRHYRIFMLLAVCACLIGGTGGCGEKNMTESDPVQSETQLSEAIAGEEIADGNETVIGDDYLYFVCEEVDLAMVLPKSVTENQIGKENPHVIFQGESDSLGILFGEWDKVSDPDLDSLSKLVSEVNEVDTETVNLNGLEAVKVNWPHGDVNYYFLSRDGDAYYLWITPYVMKDPGVYDKVKAIENSICKATDLSMNNGIIPKDGQNDAPVNLEIKDMLCVQAPNWAQIDYLVLVNSKTPLPEGWEDALDLVSMVNSVGDTVLAERTAYKAYLGLKADLAVNEGIDIDLDSAYRSVQYQQDIMERFTEKYGAAYAARTVAKPGYSEHHTGLALDLYFRLDGVEVYYNEDLVRYPEIWEKIHARLADHGFILRYPDEDGRVDYSYEPWHIRYVGKEVAAELMQDRIITLEDYLQGKD